MPTLGATLVQEIDVEAVVTRLDSFYAYNLVVVQFCQALHSRLEGQAAFLLGDELEEVAEEALGAAKRLAARVGELGGVVTADPTHLVERSPLGAFTMPESAADIAGILTHVYQHIRAIAGAYTDFLAFVRGGRDELSHQLVLRLLAEQVARASEIEAALA